MTNPASIDSYRSVAGIDGSDFKEAWQLEASVYREILWALLNEYTGGRCEMTHAEFIRNKATGEVKVISLCMTIFEDSGCNFQGFAEYIRRNIDLIPVELRSSLTAYIGYNYGNAGGVRVEGDKVEYIDQGRLDQEALKTDGKIGYAATDKLDKIHLEVLRRVREIK